MGRNNIYFIYTHSHICTLACVHTTFIQIKITKKLNNYSLAVTVSAVGPVVVARYFYLPSSPFPFSQLSLIR